MLYIDSLVEMNIDFRLTLQLAKPTQFKQDYVTV